MQVQDTSEFPIGDEINNQTDRGSAIVATAYMEDKLTDALKRWLTRDALTEEIFKRLTEPSGQLGALGTKAEIGYLLDLYGELTVKDLRWIAKIRNRFAHMSMVLDFSDDKIRSLCENLTIYERTWKIHSGYEENLKIQKPYDRARARRAFVESISILANFFSGIKKDAGFRYRLD